MLFDCGATLNRGIPHLGNKTRRCLTKRLIERRGGFHARPPWIPIAYQTNSIAASSHLGSRRLEPVSHGGNAMWAAKWPVHSR
jgi:hypothetical protein